MNDNLELLGLLPVMVDERTKITKQMSKLLGSCFFDVFPQKILIGKAKQIHVFHSGNS